MTSYVKVITSPEMMVRKFEKCNGYVVKYYEKCDISQPTEKNKRVPYYVTLRHLELYSPLKNRTYSSWKALESELQRKLTQTKEYVKSMYRKDSDEFIWVRKVDTDYNIFAVKKYGDSFVCVEKLMDFNKEIKKLRNSMEEQGIYEDVFEVESEDEVIKGIFSELDFSDMDRCSERIETEEKAIELVEEWMYNLFYQK